MIVMNNTFSFGRFKSLMAYDWAITRKLHFDYASMVIGCGILTGVFLIFEQITVAYAIFFLGYAVFTIGMMYMATLTFSNLKKKSGRINFFMLPSSNLEKFAVRCINVAFLPILTGILSFVISYNIVLFFQYIAPSGIAPFPGYHELVDKVGVLEEVYYYLTCIAIIILFSCFSNVSYAVMWSAIIRRRVFLKMVFITIGIIILLSILSPFFINLGIDVNYKLNNHHDMYLFTIMVIINNLITMSLFLFIGYMCFKRKRII